MALYNHGRSEIYHGTSLVMWRIHLHLICIVVVVVLVLVIVLLVRWIAVLGALARRILIVDTVDLDIVFVVDVVVLIDVSRLLNIDVSRHINQLQPVFLQHPLLRNPFFDIHL